MPDSFGIGLLGHGTVGGAFAELLPERAGSIVNLTGLRPEIVGVLTRSQGDFDDILERSQLIVELMGGLEPARDYVLRAMRAGKHVVTANKQLLATHGEELWATAREHGVQLRFEGAVAGVVPVIRVIQESLAGSHVDRISGIVNGTTNYILTEMAGKGMSYGDALAEAQRLGYAEADPTDDVTGKDAAAKMAILARLAFDTPVSIDDVPYEGIEHITADDMQFARDLRLGLKLIGTAERVDGGLSVRVHPALLYSGHPLASVHGPYNAVTVEAPAITEITMSGPGAGGPQTATAVLGDVISAMIPPASTPETTQRLEIVEDVVSAFYVRMEVADRPGVLAQVAEVLGMQGCSIKQLYQHGLGAEARLVMTIHPVRESQPVRRPAADQPAGLHPLQAARDPRHRGGVRLIGSEQLVGERVLLRPVEPGDAAPYVQAFADDPSLARMVGFEAPSEGEARTTFKRDARERAAGEAARFAAVADDTFAGLFLLHSFAWTHRRAECGFLVVPAARRRGAGLEALRLVVAWAFGVLGLQRVGLATLEENVATQRLAERAGFQREGVLRAYTREWDEPVDNVMYSAVASAWA